MKNSKLIVNSLIGVFCAITMGGFFYVNHLDNKADIVTEHIVVTKIVKEKIHKNKELNKKNRKKKEKITVYVENDKGEEHWFFLTNSGVPKELKETITVGSKGELTYQRGRLIDFKKD